MEMPAQRGDLSEEQVSSLISYVRTFARSREEPRTREKGGSPLAGFDKRYRRLQQEMNDLRQQYHELPKTAPGGTTSKPLEPGKLEVARRSAQRPPGPPEAAELFRQRCVKCHDAEGTGNKGRERFPDIPDFTKASWQARRADAKLLASILDGKADDMPPQRGKISEGQARSLVKYVRAFAPLKVKSKEGEPEGPSQSKPEESQSPRASPKEKHGSSRTPTAAPDDPFTAVHSPTPDQSAPSLLEVSGVEQLFQQRCVKCHGADGTGKKARDRLPEIPDFTSSAWQAQRDDAQLIASILDGKGEGMPPARGKVSEEQVRGLVTHVRAFATARGEQGATRPQGAGMAGAEEVEPPTGLVPKLLRWLGRFHPASVHFPIALLTAAAVAELLGIATGKLAFAAITRYCLWFGTLTAAGAGTLGWFLGGFRLTDSSWVLTTHRWLGTSTVVCAGLVLLLSEAGRSPERQRIRISFRVALLVVAALVSVTGFFGGAVVYGLRHYAWPK
jgi:mono/diheme cytochrome c family protein/uncharacterized membrane protein